MKKHGLIHLILIFSLLTSLNLFPAWGSDRVVAPDAQELKLQLELTKVMMDVADSLDRKIGAEENPFDHPQKLSALVQAEAQKYTRYYETTGMIPKEKIPAFRKFFSQLNWDKLVLLMKKAHLGIDIFLKRKGYGFGLSMMLGKSLQMGLTWFCMHHNLQSFVPIIMTVPWTLLATFVPVRLQKMKIESELKNTLGGAEQLNAYREQEKKILEVLHLSSEKDFFLPLSESANGKTEAIVLKNPSKGKKVLNMIGMNQEELTLINLKKFLKANNYETSYIRWVLKNPGTDDVSKTALITLSLFESADEDVQLKFRLAFEEQFRHFKASQNYGALLSWSRQMKAVNEVDGLIAAVKDLPESLRPREAALIWNDVLFPEYIRNLNLSYEEGRNFVLKSDSLKARLLMLGDSAGTAEIENELLNFISSVLGDKPSRRCQTPAAVISERLLQSF